MPPSCKTVCSTSCTRASGQASASTVGVSEKGGAGTVRGRAVSTAAGDTGVAGDTGDAGDAGDAPPRADVADACARDGGDVRTAA
jgi:hypothetical protein